LKKEDFKAAAIDRNKSVAEKAEKDNRKIRNKLKTHISIISCNYFIFLFNIFLFHSIFL
jgi:hypothetical protein